MITRIEAHNYRCFPKLAIDLDRYHVLAGANGAGKTTLLDIPVLLGDMLARAGVVAAFLERQGSGRSPRAGALTDPLYKGHGDAVAFAVEAKLPPPVAEALGETSMAHLGGPVPTHVRYELRLEIASHSMRVADEYLFLFNEADARPEPEVFPQGRSVVGTALRDERWRSVIHREGGPLTKFTPETTTQATDMLPVQLPPTQLALANVLPDQTLYPAAIWFAGL
ncbi:MAG: AAA family ATPase, partial [Sciscionella sp.]